MTCASTQRGLSLVELLAVMALATTLMLASVPPLVEIVRTSRLRAAARQVAGSIQLARSKAVSTGWQYRIVGFGAGSGGDHRNQYRMVARDSTEIDWPSATSPASKSSTQIVGQWVDINRHYPGVAINPDDTEEFLLTFDARGVPVEMSLSFKPLQITGEAGSDKLLTVSTVGNVRID